MFKLNYTQQFKLSLSLEPWHNAGLTPDETKNIIEQIPNPCGLGRLISYPTGINNNLSVVLSRRVEVKHIIYVIEDALNTALKKSKKESA